MKRPTRAEVREISIGENLQGCSSYSNSDRTWKSETGQIRLAGSPAKTRLFICRSFRSAEPSNSSPIAFSEHLSLAPPGSTYRYGNLHYPESHCPRRN